MTILHPDRTSTPSAIVMPHDPVARYHNLTNLKGLWIILISGDHAIEGWINEIARPNLASDTPAPVVTLDGAYGSVTGPVLAGDLIAAPLA